jgi:hypothetical protein
MITTRADVGSSDMSMLSFPCGQIAVRVATILRTRSRPSEPVGGSMLADVGESNGGVAWIR